MMSTISPEVTPSVGIPVSLVQHSITSDYPATIQTLPAASVPEGGVAVVACQGTTISPPTPSKFINHASMVITPPDFRNIRKIRKNIQAVRNIRNIRNILKTCQIPSGISGKLIKSCPEYPEYPENPENS